MNAECISTFLTQIWFWISHIVASSSDPCEIWVPKRLKLSVDATSSSPLGCLCLPAPSAFHSRSVSFDTSTHAVAQGHGIQKHSPALCLEALPLLLHPSWLPEVLNNSILISMSLFYLLWLAVTTVILVTVIRSPFMESGYFKCLFKEYCCRSVILQLDVLVQLY